MNCHILWGRLLTLIWAVTLAFGTRCPVEAADQTVQYRNIGAEYHTTKLLPSMISVAYVRIDYSGLVGESPGAEEQVRHTLSNGSAWILKVEGKPGNLNAIDRVVLAPVGNGIAYAILRPGSIKAKDKLVVGITVGTTTYYHATQGAQQAIPVVVTKVPPEPFVFHVDPTDVKDQELLDGSKKDVHHFSIKLDVPAVSYAENSARFYLTSDNLISTESLDKNSKIELKAGLERSLISRAYVPAFIDAKFLGNQRLSNASVVSEAGVKFLLPWRWTHSFLWSSLVKAPISPEFSFNGGYESRIRKDDRGSEGHVKKDLFRLSTEVNWKPVHFLTRKDFSSKDMSLEVHFKGWYFPNEAALGGFAVRRWESRIELGFFVPLTGFPVGFGADRKDDSALTRLKVQYFSGANEANRFARTHGVEIGFEVTK